MAENEEELMSLLMKEESGKAGLKLNIQKTRIGEESRWRRNRTGVITFSSTNSLKEQQNGEQSLQNNF